ncbi:hypothetical protein BHE74_00022749 [Ensete ventricosum]|nr:hypothetical protein BHE74_00022749 [Ensete ventricosum]RZR93273.1 hypothetical protein BHM03_00021736 [Ensete ventricosum]
MRQELVGNSSEFAESSPIGGPELTGNSSEVIGSSPIGGRELVGSSLEVYRELAEGSPKGCWEFAERSIDVPNNKDCM